MVFLLNPGRRMHWELLQSWRQSPVCCCKIRYFGKRWKKGNSVENRIHVHRYIKPLFLVLGRGLAQFKRYLNIIKCVLECPLDLHIYPFSRTKGGKIFREYLIYCFWVRLSGRKSHQLPTKLQFSPINMTDKLFEKLSNQLYSNFSWPGAFKQLFLLIMAKTSKI